VWHHNMYDTATDLEPKAPWHLMARKHIGDLTGETVLEIGCGPGQFARWLAEQGGNVVAGDFSAEACRIARRTCGDLVDVRQLDAQNLVAPLGRNRFDLVCCLETLEHVPDHNRALREIVMVAKPGGRVMVSTPNYLSLLGLNRVIMRLARKPFTEMGQPINNVTIGAARLWKLRRLGCRIDAVEGDVYQWEILGTGRRVDVRPLLGRFPLLALHVLVVATRQEQDATNQVEEAASGD
jgi:ubiquinone/menaquinone biosynthesis C-methylase UbiE